MNAVPSSSPDLPRWDLSLLFASAADPALDSALQQLDETIRALGEAFDALGIGERTTTALTDADVAAYERITPELNALMERLQSVRAFLHGLVATDSRDALAQGKLSALRRALVPLQLLNTRYTAWLGALDTDALTARSALAAAHAFFLTQARVAARHLMPPAQEALAAELNLSGASAWNRLHGDVTSQITVPLDGAPLPMSVVRSLATDGDRDRRRRAYEAEIAAWKGAAVPLAAALNSVKHETNVLTARRGWDDPLDAACFGNHIDRQTLEAMLCAARRSFPDFRRYLRAKARLVAGTEQLPWYDLFAPVGEEAADTWSWRGAEEFVAAQFDAYSPRMGDFARRAFRQRWIDAGPRPGKRDGAFCMWVQGDESRILQNFHPSFDGVSTLAHELGHAYHNLCLASRTALQRGIPMALAETASIFCETIIRDAALAATDLPARRLAILEGSLQGACQVTVDISSRFLFENRLLARRKERELSVEELCALMTEAQKETYGDGLDEATLHPYMWAVKPHYYGATYYNFPYMFGLLLGLGLYARYQADPEGFRAGYDDLLSRTGMADAAALGAEFGIDIRAEAFWDGSLAVVRADIDRFEALSQEAA